MLQAVLMCISVLPGPLRRLGYRLVMKARFAPGAKIGFGSVINVRGFVLEEGARIAPFVLIRARKLHLGKLATVERLVRATLHSLTLGPRAIIGVSTQIQGDLSDPVSEMTMGMYAWVFQHCFVNVTRQVRLGRNVGVGGGSYIFTHGYWLSQLEGFPVAYGPVDIDNDAWLPWGCFIMPNVRIGKRTVIGARSVINRNIPDDALAAGVPAKVIRDRSSRDMSWEERVGILRTSFQDFAISRQQTLMEKTEGSCFIFSLDDRPLAVVSRPDDAGETHLRTGVLNLVESLLDHKALSEYPCVSLKNYLASRERDFPSGGLAWLVYARRIGFRFYPFDEVDEGTL